MFKKFLTGLALAGLIGVAGITSAYYPGDDGFDVPSYGNATLVNSLTVGGSTLINSTTASTDYVNVNTSDNCTTGRINIDGCATNSVNPIVNVSGTFTAPLGQNVHVYSSSRDVVLDTGMAANDYDCRGSVSGPNNIDHFACFQAAWAYNGTGTMTDFFGGYFSGTILNASGTVTNGYGIYVNGFSPGFGALVNGYGVYIADQGGSTSQYSIYSVGTNDIARFDGRIGIGADPAANRPLDVYGAASVGTWRSNIWASAIDYPSIRMYASNSNTWSGVGNNNDGALIFLVGASGGTGAPVANVGYIGATGGLVLGSATGGDKGLGTINVATNIYKNNTAYTNPDYIFEHYFTNKIVKFAKNEGAKTYKGLKPLKEVRNFVEKNHVLPRVMDARNAAKNGKVGLFDGGDALLASIEEAYLYLFKHDARIAQLEQENLQLRKDITAIQKALKARK